MSVDLTADSSLDAILTEVGGFGLFQVATYFLICLPNILSASYVINYMISANTLDYRWVLKAADLDQFILIEPMDRTGAQTEHKKQNKLI